MSQQPADCPHRGGDTGRTVGCRTCSGTLQLPVLACALNPAGCVVGNRAPASDSVRACRWCADNPANARPKATPRPRGFTGTVGGADG